MDTRLRMIKELYDGDGDAVDRIHVERPDLLDEFESIRSMKSALDARSRPRPDASTVDAVLKAAADASAGLEPARRITGARQDRKPRARRAVYLRSAGVATAVVAVLIAVTTVWQSNLLEGFPPLDVEPPFTGEMAEDRGSAAEGAAEAAADQGSDPSAQAGQDPAGDRFSDARTESAPGEPDVMKQGPSGSRETARARDIRADRSVATRSVQPALAAMDRAPRRTDQLLSAEDYQPGNALMVRRPSDILPVGMRPIGFVAFTGTPDEEDLAWDQAGDVMEMYQRIEKIEEGVSLGWEPPSVPLEMVPASLQGRASGIQPAGERRTP